MEDEIEISYSLREIEESVAGTRLRFRCLEDLNRTIDEVFEQLQAKGREYLLDALCPYFGVIWPSARALCEELHERVRFREGPVRILELGCGLALPSLFLAAQASQAASRGSEIIACDFHPEVPKLLEQNIELNPGTKEFLRYRHLDWREQPETLPGSAADWIIASDVLYERSAVEPLARAIDALSGPRTRILLADPARPYLQSFLDAMSERGFAHRTSIREGRDEPVPKEIFLTELSRS